MTDKELYKESKNLFDYKDGKLIRKCDAGTRGKKGHEAGTFNGGRYRTVMINKHLYYSHRIIWLMHYKTLPRFIDHVNNDRSDNRIENLRGATAAQNQHNRAMNSNNTSGFKGVSWDRKSGKWAAQIRHDGKMKYLGRYDSINVAAKVVSDYRNKIHGEYANNG